jgi:septum formation protein
MVVPRPAAIDEAEIKRTACDEGAGPDQTALLLADLKARQIRDPDAIVIGADQLLVCEGRWFDKPPDMMAARTHLLALRGRSHELHTAVALHHGGRMIWQHIAQPRLTMRAFSDAALDAYIALEGERILSSVGAYRLEGPGIQLFAGVEGEHSAILGLPMLELLGFLRQQGVLLR